MRSFARVLLRLIAAMAVVVMATTLLLANPLTRPTSVGQAAIDAGAHSDLLQLGTDLVIRQATSGGEDEERRALLASEEESLRFVLEDAFTIDWAETTIREVAEGMERWVSDSEQPPVQISLAEPKERIRNHPDAVLLVLALADSEETEDIDPDTVDSRLVESVIEDFLAEIPDEVFLHETGWWDDLITRMGDVREGTRRVATVAGAIALLAAAIGLVIPRHTRLAAASGWPAWLMLWTAVPTLVFGGALPAAASGIPLPDEFSLIANVIGEVWAPARLVGWIALGVATGLWAITHVIRERQVRSPAMPEPIEEPERVLAAID